MSRVGNAWLVSAMPFALLRRYVSILYDAWFDQLNWQKLLIVCKMPIGAQNRQVVIDRHGANQKIGVGALYAVCLAGVE